MKRRQATGPVFFKALVVALSMQLGLFFLAACGGEKKDGEERKSSRAAQQTSKSDKDYDPPDDHTKDKDGFMHMPGYKRETATCMPCHGDDLKGGDAPSCYTCHDREWK